MTDPEPVRARLALLAEYLGDLEAVQHTPLEPFLGDKKLRRYVERTLQLAIECCLDIGHHILSDRGLREPEDNRDVFRVLAEAGYIPEDLRPDLERMAAFRNLLVHEYTRIDPVVVHGVLRKRLPDLRRFASLMASVAAAGREEPDDKPVPPHSGSRRGSSAGRGRGRRRPRTPSDEAEG